MNEPRPSNPSRTVQDVTADSTNPTASTASINPTTNNAPTLSVQSYPSYPLYRGASYGSYDSRHPWFWCDIETSGLDPYSSMILEISVKVTDSELNVLYSLHLILHHPLHILVSRSSAWCKRAFGSVSFGGNGLFDLCSQSSTSFQEAGSRLGDFFFRHTAQMDGSTIQSAAPIYFQRARFSRSNGPQRFQPVYTRRPTAMLCGSSVNFDKLFLLHNFPFLAQYLHWRIIDISSVLEMARRWRPDITPRLPPTSSTHRACIDIDESIALARFFKDELFAVDANGTAV